MSCYYRSVLLVVPVFNCGAVFFSTNPDGSFCKALVCFTSLLAALLADGVNETMFVCFWSLVLGFMLRRTTEMVQVKKLLSTKFARLCGEASFAIFGVCVNALVKKFTRNIMIRYEEIAAFFQARHAHLIDSVMNIAPTTCSLPNDSRPTHKDDHVASLIKAMCWKAFLAKFVPIAEVDCFPVTRLVDEDDADPLEVNVHIGFSTSSIITFLQQRDRYATRKSLALRARLVPRAQAKEATHVVCDILVETCTFVKRTRRGKECGDTPQLVLSVSALELNTKRDVLANVFVNNRSVKLQDVLNSTCRDHGRQEAQLAFFVRSWATERGIVAAMKGHMSRFTWTILVLYFIRNGPTRDEEMDASVTIVDSFAEFIAFYSKRFMNCQESISISIDSHACDSNTPTSQFIPRTSGVVTSEKHSSNATPNSSIGSTRALPFIENPFARDCDLGASMDSWNVFRLWEELWRASTLLENRSDATLEQLTSLYVQT